ncbi:MAG: Mrp/NBP35 family ATP-binding protein [Bdellovibrionales bacterium]|jgi:ATP-binding protein involved in chromosome partitioning|nr:Mrp/NBP35 family ATP-binding protein [Bdellovibrionales bacterium]
MSHVEKNKVIEALAAVLDPALGRLGDVTVEGDVVYAAIEVDPARGAALEPMRQAAQTAMESVPGVRQAQAILTAERKAPPELAVKSAPRGGGGFSHKISSRPVAPRVRHIIAVASGKGGVGKSTLAANLAAAFALLGKSTGLLDADIYGASQPIMTGVHTRPETNADDMIVPTSCDIAGRTLKVISMGQFVERGAPVIWRGPMVHSAIQQLFRDVEWGALDVLVVDLPPGTGDAQLSLAQYVPLSGAVIISTPQDVALSEAEKGLRMFEKTKVPVFGIVENMSYHSCENCGHRSEIFGHGGARAAAARLNVPFLGEVPLMPAIRIQADAGLPLVAADPAHPAADVFMNIAARIWAALPDKKAAV